MVSGQSTPGALVQFYLNDTLVAPAKSSQEGKVSFTIGRGVQPGSYRIRLDEVDPVSGSVKTRAEVAFAVPVEAAVGSPSKPSAVAKAEEAAAAEGRPIKERAETSLSNKNNVLVPGVNTAIVAKRESLWRISSRVYGKGVRHTEIYQANQEQIRNPNLIYPGQIFVLPSDLNAETQKP
jgi:nucleoid-associated protein YgaU